MSFFYENKMFVISALINVLLGGLCAFLYFNNECNCENTLDNINLAYETNEEEVLLDNFYVDIKGAVKNPGVYEVSNNSNINDVIKIAGGLKKDAYVNNINLSRKVYSEEVIYVFTKTEYNKLIDSKKVKTTNNEIICKCEDYDISKCTENASSEIIPNEEIKENNTINDNVTIIDSKTIKEEDNLNEDVTDNKININTADVNELMKLDGVGESKAKNIIKYRTENGSFKSIDELMNVSGIGEKMYEAIKDNITV